MVNQFLSMILLDAHLGGARRRLPAIRGRRSPDFDPDDIRRPPLHLALALLRT